MKLCETTCSDASHHLAGDPFGMASQNVDMLSAEESRVSHPAQANEKLKVKFVLFLLVEVDGLSIRVSAHDVSQCLGGRSFPWGQSNEEETPTARQVCEDLWRC